MLDKLALKKQIIILAAIVALMFVLFYMFGWSPQVSKLDQLSKEKTEQEQRLQAAKNTLSMLEEVKRNAANAEIEYIKMSNRMPSSPELPSLIVEMQNISNDAGVELVSISPGEPSSIGEYNEMKISAVVNGSYVALIDFLRRVEKAPRAFRVDNINIKTERYPDLNMTASICAFTVGEGISAPPPPPPAQNAPVQ
ncbi:MAG: type 4a pilus biogenesis protein PilO [Actinobacteria bacterium]|nr:type 4a pilus biogenesis protein PilO [Actinomycetota bacterium]